MSETEGERERSMEMKWNYPPFNILQSYASSLSALLINKSRFLIVSVFLVWVLIKWSMEVTKFNQNSNVNGDLPVLCITGLACKISILSLMGLTG